MSDALSQICQNLLTIARQRPSEMITHILANGLRVHVKYKDHRIHLYISRRAVSPSKIEFATVLKRFPGSPMIEPAEQTWQERHWLYGSWEEKLN
jgi:hypothetical protein